MWCKIFTPVFAVLAMVGCVIASPVPNEARSKDKPVASSLPEGAIVFPEDEADSKFLDPIHPISSRPSLGAPPGPILPRSRPRTFAPRFPKGAIVYPTDKPDADFLLDFNSPSPVLLESNKTRSNLPNGVTVSPANQTNLNNSKVSSSPSSSSFELSSDVSTTSTLEDGGGLGAKNFGTRNLPQVQKLKCALMKVPSGRARKLDNAGPGGYC